MNTLYRFFNPAGQLLYVGIASNLARRLSQHERDKNWWREVSTVTVEHFESRDELADAEVKAIKSEGPLYNQVVRDDLVRTREPLRSGPDGGLLVSLTEARTRLSELVRRAADGDVVLMNHGRPAAFLVGADRYDALLEEMEDLRDRLSVHERDGVTTPFAMVVAELGIADEVNCP
ncbi:MAG: type II toxin-antitoxin system prevent-host-death family antitoxin [Actinomycetota bacterium]|nr:type II toxin-antitoxin system prevent-host-death family antitoxin [Actinomycetota bacterium]